MVLHWSEADKNKLVVMRAARVPFALIAVELGRTENACHTKFYNLVDRDGKQDRYMEILSDPMKSIEDKMTTGEVQAVGRAILRGKGFEVNGRANTVTYNNIECGIHTVIGAHLILGEALFDVDKDYVVVWLHPSGRTVFMSTGRIGDVLSIEGVVDPGKGQS